MGDEVNNSFSEVQKKVIYKEMLVPLKLNISQILLYDTKAALEFLQEYNEIVENEDLLGNNIIQTIVELELKIQNYMSKEGKEKVFKERSKVVLQRIENLRINSIQLSLEEFEIRFAEIKQSYEEVSGNYSFNDREKIEREIYALQASLIMRQIAEGKAADELQQTITEQDKAGLNIFVVEQINNLRQKDTLKDIADRVNNIVITDNDAVLRPELWKWLNVAEKGIKRDEQFQIPQPTTSTAMIVAPKNKNITFKDKISKLYSKEPTFPLQAIDLRKINIEWLSKYIPKSMLLELESDRLSEENRQVNDRYVPDSRAVIYEVMEDISKMMERYNEKEYKFIKENGSEFSVKICEDLGAFARTEVEMKSGKIRKMGYRSHAPLQINFKPHAFNEALAYASLLDKVFNTDFQQQLLQYAQDIYIDKKHKPTPVYDNLMLSLKKMLKEYNYTKLNFEATEEAKRKEFYKINGFKEELKHKDVLEREKKEVKIKKDKQFLQSKNHNDDGTEQDIQ